MRAAAVVVMSVLVLALLPVGSSAQLPDEGSEQPVSTVVASFDGTPIVVDLYLPEGASASTPVPVVFSGHGWGLTRDSQAGNATFEVLRAAGYALVVWDARGFGQSGGTVQINDPTVEGRDTSAIIDWVSTRPEILLDAPGDPVMGMIGPSYGGGIQLATATFDPRVDALAPEITWHDLNRALQPQGVLKLVWQLALFGLGTTTGTILGLDPTGPAAPQTGTVPPELLEAMAQALVTNEFDGELTAYFAQRSFADYRPGGLLDIPTLLMQGSVDTLFTIDEAVDTFEVLRAQGTPTKLVVFCGGLDAAIAGGAVTHGQCPSFYEPAGDRERLDDLILRWFDRHLRGMAVDTGPPVEYRTNTGHWHRADTWPPPATRTMTVPLEGTALAPGLPGNGLGILALAAPANSPAAVTVVADDASTAGRQVEVVGQPVMSLDATGLGLGANLFARLVDPGRSELSPITDALPPELRGVLLPSAVNNQETPLLLGPLSATPQTRHQPMVNAAYTYAPGSPVAVQVDTQSLMYTFARTGPAQVDLDGAVEIPYRTLVADRIGGPTRIGTAAELSRDSVLATDTVVLATAADYPDALAGAPLATALAAPLLLTGPDGLADQAVREIRRLGATEAVLLGGTSALGEGVAADLTALGLTVRRVEGADRFATAAAVAAELESTTAYLVEGINSDPARGWPDAVSAAAPAAITGSPVLLTGRDDLPQATLDALSAGGVTEVVIVGGTAAVSAGVQQQVEAAGITVTRLSGPDRYTTSATVAATDPQARTVVAATGRDWPDALAAASASAAWEAILVLVDGQDLDASPATRDLVEALAFDRLVVTGLAAAVGEGVAEALAQAADRGSVPPG